MKYSEKNFLLFKLLSFLKKKNPEPLPNNSVNVAVINKVFPLHSILQVQNGTIFHPIFLLMLSALGSVNRGQEYFTSPPNLLFPNEILNNTQRKKSFLKEKISRILR